MKFWKQTLRYRIVRNEKKGLLTGKKSFCKETENFLPSGKKQSFALNYLKFGRLIATTTHPAAVRAICICADGRNIHRFYCFLFQAFPETTAKPRII